MDHVWPVVRPKLCSLSDATNYSSSTHARVRRSNSLTPPVSITQTSDFWSSQVCCSSLCPCDVDIPLSSFWL
jgi:hypothetical protein